MFQLKHGLLAIFFIMSAVDSALAEQAFPRQPDLSVTPGDLCHSPNELRYAERIKYCDRNVPGELKAEVIQTYDQQLGFSIRAMRRGLFKIDHYIPLCVGGSNQRQNLWPQHRSIYQITDRLEFAVCQKMSEGKLKQAEAIELIKQGKTDLEKVEGLLKKLKSIR